MSSTQEDTRTKRFYTPGGVLKETRPLNAIPEIRAGLMVFAKTEGQMQAGARQVGTVDRLDGEHYVKMASHDSPDGKHHWIPLGWVASTDAKVAYLNKTQEEFRRGQLNEFPGDEKKIY